MSESRLLWNLRQVEQALDDTDGLDKLDTFYVVYPLTAELPPFKVSWNPALRRKRLSWPKGLLVMDEHHERNVYETEDGGHGIDVGPSAFVLGVHEREGVYITKAANRKVKHRIRWSVYHALRGVAAVTETEVMRLEVAAGHIGLTAMETLTGIGGGPDSLVALLADCESWEDAVLFAAAFKAHPLLEASAYRAEALGGRWVKGFPGGWVLTTGASFRAASKRVLAAVAAAAGPATQGNRESCGDLQAGPNSATGAASFTPTKTDMEILAAMDPARETLYQLDIERRCGRVRSVVSARLPILEHEGLVSRPHGPRKGYAITDAGRALLGRK